jgi:hypothetical protein
MNVPSSRIALSPKTMTSNSPSPCNRVNIWRLGRLLALTSRAQTPIRPTGVLASELTLSFLDDPAVLKRRLDDNERAPPIRAFLSGNADSTPSALVGVPGGRPPGADEWCASLLGADVGDATWDERFETRSEELGMLGLKAGGDSTGRPGVFEVEAVVTTVGSWAVVAPRPPGEPL